MVLKTRPLNEYVYCPHYLVPLCPAASFLLQQNAYMISSRSVTDGVSLSVIESKLDYSSLIFVDNKLTPACLLT